jgi:glycosyltransferase involved in cell wall biosynthesis
MNAGRIAAVVVRWKGGEEVERCLRSLETEDPAKPDEIVLVDAGSADGGAEHLAKVFPSIRVEALGENPGFAGAANLGVRRTSAEIILLLNPDTEILPGALDLLTTHLLEHPRLAGVVPLLENTDGSSQFRWQLKELPTPRDLGRGHSGKPTLKRRPTGPTTVSQPAAAVWLIRRQVWDALQGFEPAFFPAWWEDVDFCARLQWLVTDPTSPWNEAWQVIPSAGVRHEGGSSVSSLGHRAFLDAFFGNLLKYAHRHHHRELPAIRKRLRHTLITRGILRPSRFRDYLRASKKLGTVLNANDNL